MAYNSLLADICRRCKFTIPPAGARETTCRTWPQTRERDGEANAVPFPSLPCVSLRAGTY